MRASKNLKLIGVIALVVAVVFSVVGYAQLQRQASIEKDGITVEGMIQRAESIHKGSGRKKVDRDIFEVSYTPVGGKPVTASFSVTRTFYGSRVQENVITNPAVQVRYLADSPTDRLIVGGSHGRGALLWAGLAFGGIGILLMVVGIRQKPSSEMTAAAPPATK